MAGPPLVSVVTATYNRSNVLRYTIMSLIDQTFGDWELIVVGDACTDDTGAVVASFEDPRIQFINLAANVGEQSGPNNEGAGRTRGKYLAYLNHDDLWMPDHLATAVAELEGTGADLVFCLGLDVLRGKPPRLRGIAPGGKYAPHVAVPGSLWVFRRALVAEIGPWRFYRELFNNPSQDWLFRVWKAGKYIRPIPRLTMIKIASGGRTGSYSGREYRENEQYYRAMSQDPQFLQGDLVSLAANFAGRDKALGLWAPMRRLMRNVLFKICFHLRIHPKAMTNLVRHRRRGGHIDYLRRLRGLPPLPRRKMR